MKLTMRFFKYLLFIMGLLSSLSSFAETVTWRLSFADETGKEVGAGQFTYDTETSKDVMVRDRSDLGFSGYTFGRHNPHEILTNTIDSISVNLLGKTYRDELSRISFDPIALDFPSLRVLEYGWWDETTGSGIKSTDYAIYDYHCGGNCLTISISDKWRLWGANSVENTGVHPNDLSYEETNKILDFSITDRPWLMDSGPMTGSWRLFTDVVIDDFETDDYPITEQSGFYYANTRSYEFEENSGTVTATRIMESHSCNSALYTPNKGEISINTLDINGKPYNVVLKKTGGYDFTITKISRDRSDSACQQAEYISNKGIIDIPVLDINGKNYKVMMKKKGGYDFEIKQISRIK